MSAISFESSLEKSNLPSQDIISSIPKESQSSNNITSTAQNILSRKTDSSPPKKRKYVPLSPKQRKSSRAKIPSSKIAWTSINSFNGSEEQIREFLTETVTNLLSEKRHEDAEAFLKDAFTCDKSQTFSLSVKAHLYSLRCSILLNHYEAIREECKKTAGLIIPLENNPKQKHACNFFAQHHLVYGMILYAIETTQKTTNYEPALEQFIKGIYYATDPKIISELYLRKAILLLDIENAKTTPDYKTVLASIQKGLECKCAKNNNVFAELFYWKAILTKNINSALQFLNQGINLQPSNDELLAKLYWKKALILYEKNQYEPNFKEIHNTIRLGLVCTPSNEMNEKLYAHQAFIHNESGKFVEAVRSTESALNCFDGSFANEAEQAKLYYLKALALAYQDKHEDALTALAAGEKYSNPDQDFQYNFLQLQLRLQNMVVRNK